MRCDKTIFSVLLSYDIIKQTIDNKVIEFARALGQMDVADILVASGLPFSQPL